MSVRLLALVTVLALVMNSEAFSTRAAITYGVWRATSPMTMKQRSSGDFRVKQEECPGVAEGSAELELYDNTDREFRSLESCPALVLNADYQPLSYLPLSLWPWQEAIKAVWMDRVVVLATHDRYVRSANVELKLPSVIALKGYVNQHAKVPSFTRRNLYLRDGYQCAYCSKQFQAGDLSFDHVTPRKLGGPTSWTNVVTSCHRCNNAKGDCHPKSLSRIGMRLNKAPHIPTFYELQNQARRYPPKLIHKTWAEYLYYDSAIEARLQDEQL
ncbi:HNH endonuclease family protein [Tribonema minus]|uniref:HNH endonuclease family protein n=1 Tax=Tribonema minus TaxID=303371 RepID=A0A836CK35_9STRA|nr:HNH endonuclease family protein [Tribonema minus]